MNIEEIKQEFREATDKNNVLSKYSSISNENVKLLEKAMVGVLREKPHKSKVIAELMYKFASLYKGKGANIKGLCRIIGKTKESELIYKFASEIVGADVNYLAKRIVELKEVNYMFCFARNVDGVDLKILSEGIAKYGKVDDICSFAKQIKGADIEVLSKAMVNKRYSKKVSEFIFNVEVDNIDIFLPMIVTSKRPKDIYRFAEVYGNEKNINKLTQAIIDCADPRHIFGFARYIEGADIRKLEDAIIKTGSIEYIGKFITDVKDSDKHKLLEALKQEMAKQNVYTNRNNKTNK